MKFSPPTTPGDLLLAEAGFVWDKFKYTRWTHTSEDGTYITALRQPYMSDAQWEKFARTIIEHKADLSNMMTELNDVLSRLPPNCS